MTYRDVISVLEENGFRFARYGKGSHRVYRADRNGKKLVSGLVI